MSRYTRLHDHKQLEAEAFDWLDWFLVGLLLGCILVAGVAGHAMVSAGITP